VAQKSRSSRKRAAPTNAEPTIVQIDRKKQKKELVVKLKLPSTALAQLENVPVSATAIVSPPDPLMAPILSTSVPSPTPAAATRRRRHSAKKAVSYTKEGIPNHPTASNKTVVERDDPIVLHSDALLTKLRQEQRDGEASGQGMPADVAAILTARSINPEAEWMALGPAVVGKVEARIGRRIHTRNAKSDYLNAPAEWRERLLNKDAGSSWMRRRN